MNSNLLEAAGETESAKRNLYVRVVVPPVPTEFTYSVPYETQIEGLLGSRVSVPFGKRITFGYVVAVDSAPPTFSKSSALLDGKTAVIKSLRTDARIVPCFSTELLELFRWMATYYSEPLSSIIDLAIPNISAPVKDTIVTKIECDAKIRGKGQEAVLEHLKAHGGTALSSEIYRLLGTTSATLKALATKGAVKLERIDISQFERDSAKAVQQTPSLFELNVEQKDAFEVVNESLRSNEFRPFLLHGITGSGKTEVYINLAAQALEAGKGVLIIVPEIGLTPQAIERFESRLTTKVAVLHSGIGKRPRWDGWNALLDGSCRIAIGARSGVFAPIKNLGLIVVDEEHDHSFKQSEGVRYHARDVAVIRAKHASCPVVLGSATPALDTYHLARSGKYTLLRLNERHNNVAYPKLQVVDLNQIKPWELPSRSVSPTLHDALRETLGLGQQAFILYNRRGFASFLQCDRCGLVLECPHCSVTLTYYQKRSSLLCHYCGYTAVPVSNCPVCPISSGKRSKTDIEPVFSPRGGGTERVFDELASLFPDARIERLDRDVVNSVEDYKSILNRVRNGQIDILVGTQLLAKGHDLPNVTLVGIVDCDVGLHMPDFRAGERVFQLITQASGRAGRASLPGRAILQTRVPNHPSVKHSAAHDFNGFAEEELASRRAFLYPPYSRLLRIICSSQSQALATQRITEIANQARTITKSLSPAIQVMGPVPAPLERLRGYWRCHIVLRCESVATLHRALVVLRKQNRSSKTVRLAFDIDPQDMM